jgi:hypothetical protein
MIQDDGIVSTGAGMHSPQPLHVTAKSQNRAGSLPSMEPSIGEEKAKCPAPSCPEVLYGIWQEDKHYSVCHVTQPKPGRLGISPMPPDCGGQAESHKPNLNATDESRLQYTFHCSDDIPLEFK